MFRRLEPKLRLSYSLYKLWAKNDWRGIWDYLTETNRFPSEAIQKGKRVHSWLENNGLPKKLKRIADKSEGYKIIDYKTGSLNGYASQLNYYAWLTSFLKPNKEKRELKLELEFEDFIAVGVIDHFIPDSKTGIAILAQVAPIEKNGEIKEVLVTKTMAYEINDAWLMDWEMIMSEVANSIKYAIREGHLDDYLKHYYF